MCIMLYTIVHMWKEKKKKICNKSPFCYVKEHYLQDKTRSAAISDFDQQQHARVQRGKLHNLLYNISVPGKRLASKQSQSGKKKKWQAPIVYVQHAKSQEYLMVQGDSTCNACLVNRSQEKDRHKSQ